MLANAHAAPRSFEIWLKADVTIDADGSIESLQWQDQRNQLLIDKAEPQVKRWEFMPGSVDGVPARTESHLTIQVMGVEQTDGTVALKFGNVNTGARARIRAVPRYPPNAARANVSAQVVAEIRLEADGVSIVETLTFNAKRNSYRSEFISAAETAIKSWTFDLERVAGRPVASRVRIPIDFCTSGSNWCEQQEKKRLSTISDAPSAPPGSAVPLTSVVQLVTQVSGREI